MNRPQRRLAEFLALLATGVALAGRCPLASAATSPFAPSAPVPTRPAADKSGFTLFNPTPADLTRDMDTDRPNATNSPHTIDAGHLQVEAGAFDYGYDRQRFTGTNTRSDSLALGQFNLRLGVLDNLEVNAIVNAYAFTRNTDYLAGRSVRQNGVGDTFVGAKLNLWGNEGSDTVGASGLAIQPQFKIPTARESVGNGHPELFVAVPFLVNLPAGLHLGVQTTPSWERNTAGTGYVAGWQNSVAVDRVFFGKLDAYVEYAAHVSTQRHQLARQSFDVGMNYALTDNVVIDTGFAFGLNKATQTFEWLAGVSVRF